MAIIGSTEELLIFQNQMEIPVKKKKPRKMRTLKASTPPDMDWMGRPSMNAPTIACQRYETLMWYPRLSRGNPYEGDHTAGPGPILYQNTQDLLARFFLTAHYKFGKVKNWRERCVGVSSAIWTGRDSDDHMPFLDYDGRNVKKLIRQDVKTLQENYNLGHAWVYETKRGFHVYFFCDSVTTDTYLEMLRNTQACPGFRKMTTVKREAVLRVSAKYTEFDIKLLYVLKTKSTELKRMLPKAHIIRALIALGQECETHFASLYPKWAFFKEDTKPWSQPPQNATPTKGGKRIRKAKPPIKIIDLGELEELKAVNYEKMKESQRMTMYKGYQTTKTGEVWLKTQQTTPGPEDTSLYYEKY